MTEKAHASSRVAALARRLLCLTGVLLSLAPQNLYAVASITIVKDSIPNDGGATFNFTATGGLGSPFTLTDPGDTTEAFPGLTTFQTYTITEDALAGWNLTNLTCTGDTDSGSTIDIPNRNVAIDLDDGENITCTFENKKQASITIVKDSIPNDGGATFNFTATGGLGSPFTLTDPGDTTEAFPGLTTFQTYTITEDALAGWNLTNLTCTGDTDSGSTIDIPNRNVAIDLDEGENITCTFENKKQASITIVKDSIPNDGGATFNFTATGGLGSPFTLTDPGDTTEAFPGLTTFQTYTITEDALAGWNLTNLTCTGDTDSGSTIDIPNRNVAIDLDEGENITCTFENKKQASITIVKDSIPNDGGATFNFTATGGLGSPFTLTDPGDTTEAFPGLTTFQTYTITEDALAGWNLTNLTCTGDTDSGSTIDIPNRNVAIDLDEGENITCTFENKKQASITIVKDSIPNDGGATFNFTATGGLGSPFTLTDPGDTTEAFPGLTTFQTYTITEDALAGWNLTNLTCTGDTDSGSTIDIPNRNVAIDLDEGENITCTFTNSGQPILTIDKTHTDPFTQGQVGAIYTLTVSNIGNVATSGTYTVNDALPAGLTATAHSGGGWTCPTFPIVGPNPVVCTRNATLQANTAAPNLLLTVTVASDAPSQVTNMATVSGGGDPSDDMVEDLTNILSDVDLVIVKSHSGDFIQGQIGATYTLTVSNTGGGNSSGTITVTDILPSDLTPTAASGTDWTCPITANTVTCTTTAVVSSGGGNADLITLTVNVGAIAPASVTNTATVSGGNDGDTSNNDASDPTTIHPRPLISPVGGLDPSVKSVGDSAFTLNVNGSNFDNDAIVLWDGSQTGLSSLIRVDSTQLTVLVDQSLISTAGTEPVTVKNVGTTAESPAKTFTILLAPVISSLDPNSETAGAPGFTLTVNGSNFLDNMTVTWDSDPLVTTFESDTKLLAVVDASRIATDGVASVQVIGPGGTSSATSPFTIAAPGNPLLSSINPDTKIAGDPSFTLTASGSNFRSDSDIQWDATPLTTTFINAETLIATVDAPLIASAGTAQVKVVTPSLPDTAALGFTINSAGTPILGLINPSQVIAGGDSFLLTASGSNFADGFKIKWDSIECDDLSGKGCETTFVNDQTLVATVNSTLITTVGVVNVSVLNPMGPVESNSKVLDIVAGAPPEITSLSPVSVTAGESGFTIFVNGQNFVSSSTVHWTGGGEDTDLTTTFLGSQTLSAQVPEALIDKVDVSDILITISLTNPDSTNTKTFTIQPALEPMITSLLLTKRRLETYNFNSRLWEATLSLERKHSGMMGRCSRNSRRSF